MTVALIIPRRNVNYIADVVIQTFSMIKSEQANQGIVITTGGCTKDAMGYASENVGNELIDCAKLEELTNTHIDS